MRNNSVQCAEDEREIKYFDFRTFGAAAPHLRRPRRAPEAIIGRACDNTPVSSRAERGIPRRPTRYDSVGCDEGNFSFPEESLLSGGVCEIFRYAQNDKD